MPDNFHIDPDIANASTLPARFYRDPRIFEKVRQKVFKRAWHCVGDRAMASSPNSAHPFYLLDGFLPEPMVLTRDSGMQLHCLSNVCTHRGNLLAAEACMTKKLVCNYHGRRFSLDGSFEFMPEFKEASNFPRPEDNLHHFPLVEWGPLLFTAIDPVYDLAKALGIMEERVGFMRLDALKADTARHREFDIDAHWALYCDNYLEGFHIPFVHAGLNSILDYGQYDTLTFDHLNLQIGYANAGSEDIFQFPEGHIDFGKEIAAYYFWLFPNMMFNFYPWGLSLNIVRPVDIARTRVEFLTFVGDPEKTARGAGAALDRVEEEDEAVVRNVQRGVQSEVYSRGRYSPKREKGVHHFHRLLADFMNR